MLDKLMTYIMCWYKTCIRSCLVRKQTTSQHVASATRSDIDSHNRLDLIQSLVPTRYVCKGYLSKIMYVFL